MMEILHFRISESVPVRGNTGSKMRIIISDIFIHHFTIGLMSRMFANGLGDWGSVSGRVIPKT